jgi:hypothetical protein
MRLMDVRDPALLEPVLARLTELLEGGAQVNRMLLQQRIQATESALDDAEVTARLAALRRSLG